MIDTSITKDLTAFIRLILKSKRPLNLSKTIFLIMDIIV